MQVGHAGTLDPMATGALPLALGQASKMLMVRALIAVALLPESHPGLLFSPSDCFLTHPGPTWLCCNCTGLLACPSCCTACCCVQYLPSNKEYLASIKFGVQTTTDDVTGWVTSVCRVRRFCPRECEFSHMSRGPLIALAPVICPELLS
jgi:hypothetical protein